MPTKWLQDRTWDAPTKGLLWTSFRAMREQLTRVSGILPVSGGQNLAWTVFHVPYSVAVAGASVGREHRVLRPLPSTNPALSHPSPGTNPARLSQLL